MIESESILSFYDSIADQYENHLTENDRKARTQIKAIFNEYVKEGIVLDFGGGTGLDLPWLLNKFYKIHFLEPSQNMRKRAKRKYSDNSKINFLNENLDFNNWEYEKPPFTEKVDGVLANFAVVNCIPKVNFFLKKISLVCKSRAHIIITAIDPSFISVVKNYSPLVAFKLLFNGRLTVLNKNEGVYHETYLHSIREIKEASQEFELIQVSKISHSNFIGLVLFKK